MKSVVKTAVIAALVCLSLPALAGVSLNGVRVGAKDSAAVAKFYLEREPFEFGKTGIFIGMAIDPAGNHVELRQQPKAAPAPAKK